MRPVLPAAVPSARPPGPGKRLRKWARLPLRLLVAERRPGVTILMYHRVGGGTAAEIDLPPDLFQRQVAYLQARYPIVSLDTFLSPADRPRDRDAVVLTFDDGYAEMYTVILPVLHRYGVPAVVYLPTAYIEEQRPFDWGQYRILPAAERPRPLSWDQVRALQASGLVTVGVHTHTHADLSRAAPGEIRREVAQSNALLAQRLGIQARHFAYPFGRVSPAARAVVERTYATAVHAGAAKTAYDVLSLWELPRVPVSASDGYWLFRLRLSALPGAPPRRPVTHELT